MKITKVEYSKTFNLGNYQSAKIGLECEITEEEFRDHGYRTHLDQLKEHVEFEGAKLKP